MLRFPVEKRKTAMLIGLVGRKRSGKDTVADHLCGAYGFKKMALATPLKEACKIMFNLTDDQVNGDSKDITDARYGVTPRGLLQILGTDIVRNYLPTVVSGITDSFWIDRMMENFEAGYKNIVITDVRFPNEADAIKEHGGYLIKLVRNTGYTDTHESEAYIDDISCDVILFNNGTIEDLKHTIDNL